MNLQTWRMNRGRASTVVPDGAPIVRDSFANEDVDADRDVRNDGTDPSPSSLFQEIGIATPGRYRV